MIDILHYCKWLNERLKTWLYFSSEDLKNNKLYLCISGNDNMPTNQVWVMQNKIEMKIKLSQFINRNHYFDIFRWFLPLMNMIKIFRVSMHQGISCIHASFQIWYCMLNLMQKYISTWFEIYLCLLQCTMLWYKISWSQALTINQASYNILLTNLISYYKFSFFG